MRWGVGSANMPSIIDLRTQLADRVLRARALIDYINSNGLLGKVSLRLLCVEIIVDVL